MAVTLMIAGTTVSGQLSPQLQVSLAECQEVENALTHWGDFSELQKEALADTGTSCTVEYPALYGSSPHSNGSAQCDAFSNVPGTPDTACAESLPDVTNAHASWCTSTQLDPETVCVRMVDQGRGWSEIAYSSGHVLASGHNQPECTWSPEGGIESHCTTAKEWIYAWELPGAQDCHETTTTTQTYAHTLLAYELPNGAAVDVASADCP